MKTRINSGFYFVYQKSKVHIIELFLYFPNKSVDFIVRLTEHKPRKHKKPDWTGHQIGLQHNEVIMTTKSNILKSAFIAASISAGIAVAYAFQPAKVADDSHQVIITAQKYEVLKRTCNETCVAIVKADEYSIYVRYQMDDASVDRTEILNVVHSDETVNAYIDRYEIEKINAAIAGGVK